MSFGAHTFGGGYFGGSPAFTAGPETITGTGACVLQSLTCSGTGTVPSHGPQQTVWGLSGVTSVPLKPRRKRPKPKRTIHGIARMSVGPVECAGHGARRHKRRGKAAVVVAAPVQAATGAVFANEMELANLALAMMDDPGARFGILLDRRWR